MRLGDISSSVHDLAADDTFSWPTKFIHQRNVAHAGLEFLDALVVLRIVFDMCHYKLAAAFFRGNLVENAFHFLNRVGNYRTLLQLLLGLVVQIFLHCFQRRCKRPNSIALRNRFLLSCVPALEHYISALYVSWAKFENHRHAPALPVEELPAGSKSVPDIHMRSQLLSEFVCQLQHL